MPTISSGSSPLHVKLWRAVYDELARANLGIEATCLTELRDFIDTGVTNLTSVPTQPPAAEKVEGAELKLRLFARQLAAATLAAGANQVTKSIFDAAKSLLCPLYPFCD